MTTALTIPAYAQRAVAVGVRSALTSAATGGVGGNAPFPHISIKQSRWRLVDVEGEETIVKSFAIEFAVVSINPAVSKSFYMKQYSPGDDPTAPDCFSDDGRTPSQDADHIQSASCATCANNVWGSALNPTNGKKLKACKDAKRLSLMFLGDVGEPNFRAEIFSWRLAAMSMINFSNFAKEVASSGSALDFIVVRAEFDDTAEYPLVNYSVSRNMTEAEYNAVQEARNSPEAKQSVGIAEPSGVAPLVERVKPAPAPAPIEAEVDAKATNAALMKAAVAEELARRNAQIAAETATQKKSAKPKETEAEANKKAFDAAVAAAVLEQLQAGFPDVPELESKPTAKTFPDVEDVQDVQEKPRQRSPLNVVKPEVASVAMEDLLARALG